MPNVGPEGPLGPVSPPPAPADTGFDWNPVSWVTSAGEWTAGELVSAFRWSKSEVGKLAGWTVKETEAVGNDVAGFVEKGLHGLEELFWRVINEVHHGLTVANHDIHVIGGWAASATKWIEGSESWVWQRIDGGIHALERDALDPIRHDIAHLFDLTRHTVAAGVDRALNEVHRLEATTIHDLSSWVDASGGWFAREFEAAWSTIYNDAIGPAIHDLKATVEEFATAAEWVAVNGPTILKLVIDAADWLLWFGEHSLADIDQLLTNAGAGFTLTDLKAAAAKTPDYTDQFDKTMKGLVQ